MRLRLVVLHAAAAASVVNSWPVNVRHCRGHVRHVTIAVGRDPSTEMIISFASLPSNFEAPVGAVMFGTNPSQLTTVFVQDDVTHYNLQPNNPKLTNYDNRYYSPYYHHVTLQGLEPGTTYYYKPLVQPTLDSFRGTHLRRANTTITTTTLQTGDFVEELKHVDQVVAHGPNRGRGRRRLVEWGPYNGTKKACPSPDKIRSFRTVRRDRTTLELAIMGDIGQFPHSEELLSRMMMNRNQIDAVILAGDLSYSGEDHRQWDTFMDFLDDYPLAEHVPMMICPGNHDIDKDEVDPGIFLAYENRFRMPRVHPPQLGLYQGPVGHLNMDAPPYPLPYEWGNAYYSFSYGPAHVIMINSYSSMEPNSTQYRWIVSELEQVDRTVTPWVLAVLHTPIYNTFSLHQHDLQIFAAREHLEPLLVQYRVNFVFSGHIHAYLRTTTVSHESVDATGPMHITVGAGGRKCEAPFKHAIPEEWVAVRDATVFGYGIFRIHNATVAEWDWVHTGHNDNRDFNQIGNSNVTLPAGPGRDQVFVQNQYFMEA